MKTKSIFLAFATLLALLATSCSKKTYYQVYQTKAVDTAVCSQVGNYLVHEESDCVVRYNFYAEEGDAGFWLTNKTDSIIYVDLGETFFVLNGNASDYFQARQWTTTRSSTVSSSKRETKGRGNRASSESASQTSTKASTFSERRVIAVPPQSTRYFSPSTTAPTALAILLATPWVARVKNVISPTISSFRRLSTSMRHRCTRLCVLKMLAAERVTELSVCVSIHQTDFI